MGLVGPRVLNYLSESKVKAATIQIQSFASSLDLFYLDLGRYPTTSEGLAALVQRPGGATEWNGPYLKNNAVPNDPWGHPYMYRSPGEHSPYEIVSLGSDGQEGGTGTAADIKSSELQDDWTRWAESGFTLLETVCVLAIIAMLAAIALPAIPRATSRTALEAYALQTAALLKGDRNAAIRDRRRGPNRTQLAVEDDPLRRERARGAIAGRRHLQRDPRRSMRRPCQRVGHPVSSVRNVLRRHDFPRAARRRLRSPHHLADGGNRGCSSPRPLRVRPERGPRPERADLPSSRSSSRLPSRPSAWRPSDRSWQEICAGPEGSSSISRSSRPCARSRPGLPDRANLAAGTLSGDMHGQAWSVDIAPLPDDGVNPRAAKVWTPQTVAVAVQSPSGARFQARNHPPRQRNRWRNETCALVPSLASGESGFTLLEALIAVALTGVILAMLATVTGHWMANWRTGFDRVQSADLLGLGVDRIAADLAAAEYVSLGGDQRADFLRRDGIRPSPLCGPRLAQTRRPGLKSSGWGKTRTHGGGCSSAPGRPSRQSRRTPWKRARLNLPIRSCWCGRRFAFPSPSRAATASGKTVGRM